MHGEFITPTMHLIPLQLSAWLSSAAVSCDSGQTLMSRSAVPPEGHQSREVVLRMHACLPLRLRLAHFRATDDVLLVAMHVLICRATKTCAVLARASAFLAVASPG